MPNLCGQCQESASAGTDGSGQNSEVQESVWQQLPDIFLVQVFFHLEAHDVANSAQTCSHWHRVALDELLWKRLFYRDFRINSNIPRYHGGQSWYGEYQRMFMDTPCKLTHTWEAHRDQVLHVSCSHNGQLIATCSKDGHIKVWNFPSLDLRFSYNMHQYSWKYTQYSQFNSLDTLLLVSGVHFGECNTSGEIAIFSMRNDLFEIQCRVQNKPYDVFGCWFDDAHLLSGNLFWLGNLSSTSFIYLNKAHQVLHSEYEPVMIKLLQFFNANASSVRSMTVTVCPDEVEASTSRSQPGNQQALDVPDQEKLNICKKRSFKSDSDVTNMTSVTEDRRHVEVCSGCNCKIVTTDGHNRITATEATADGHPDGSGLQSWDKTDGLQALTKSDHRTDQSDRQALSTHESSYELPRKQKKFDNSVYTAFSQGKGIKELDISDEMENISSSVLPPSASSMSGSSQSISVSPGKGRLRASHSLHHKDRYLLFTTGSQTFTAHQIGVKRISFEEAVGKMKQQAMDRQRQPPAPLEGSNNPYARQDIYDKPDHIIEMHGHVIGMCVSPDQRSLYVNVRPWPEGCQISDPLEPPPIAQEVEIHMIDLLTMENRGAIFRGPKAYTPNDECFFIFLDVSDTLIASGGEDHHGYLWDRHYQCLLHSFRHRDVVNSVAFNPRDQHTLFTAGDDNKLSVWQSRRRCRELAAAGELKKPEGSQYSCKPCGIIHEVVI